MAAPHDVAAESVWAIVRQMLPRRADYAGLRRSWRGDVVAGLTVGVVALPLALAFGITTGLGAQAGLITAIVAGLVGGDLRRVERAGVGPDRGDDRGAGADRRPLRRRRRVRRRADGRRADRRGRVRRPGRAPGLHPVARVEGFTVGIAMIIFLQQVPAALGVAKPDGENTAAVAVRAVARRRSAAPDARRDRAVALVGRDHGRRPADPPIPAGVAAGRRWRPPSCRRSRRLDVASDRRAARLAAHCRRFPTRRSAEISEPASAPRSRSPLLAAIESLLSAKVADGMADNGRHDPDRELFGQGLANLVSPLFGGMPATGAIARTAVNVRAGARTRVAAIFHALVLLLVVFFGGALVAEIPLAALAGVLMVTAVRMVELHNVRAVLRATRSDAVVLVAHRRRHRSPST